MNQPQSRHGLIAARQNLRKHEIQESFLNLIKLHIDEEFTQEYACASAKQNLIKPYIAPSAHTPVFQLDISHAPV